MAIIAEQYCGIGMNVFINLETHSIACRTMRNKALFGQFGGIEEGRPDVFGLEVVSAGDRVWRPLLLRGCPTQPTP
jgi:hypothetical protein